MNVRINVNFKYSEHFYDNDKYSNEHSERESSCFVTTNDVFKSACHFNDFKEGHE